MSIKCPFCGTMNEDAPYKTWEIRGRVQKAGGKHTGRIADPMKKNCITIKQYRCVGCKRAFRKGSRNQ